MDLLVSFDSDLSQVQDLNDALTIKRGKGFRLNKSLKQWCTSCYIYIMLDVHYPSRYYMTAQAISRDISMKLATSTIGIVNAQTQECFYVNVDNAAGDIFLTFNTF